MTRAVGSIAAAASAPIGWPRSAAWRAGRPQCTRSSSTTPSSNICTRRPSCDQSVMAGTVNTFNRWLWAIAAT
ncbi:MAG: hypothetical protein R2705_21995 [Ilumatobacteraceae bacterium]